MSDGSKDIIRLPERVWNTRFNKVEAHKAVAEIVTKHEEITERMWLVRHEWKRRDDEEVSADALAAATRIREKYAEQTKHGQPLLEWDRENWPLLEGWMAALRWAISSESVGEDDSGLYDT